MHTHQTPEHMARCLVSYMPCDRAVRSAILSEFNTSPGLSKIALIRSTRAHQDEWFARGKQGGDFASRGWDWRGDQLRMDMAIASQVFVKAIERERRP